MSTSTQPAVQIAVPNHAFSGDEPLVATMRGRYVNNLHRGQIAVSDPDGNLSLAIGNPEQPVFLRSAAKPFQAMPAVLSGGIERFGISQRELAVLCSSHHAEPRHMEAVLSVLEKIGLPESALQCGVHEPIHPETARRRAQEGLAPTPVCNNCSGAHTAMLVACRARGWRVDGYGQPDHPLQGEIRQVLSAFTDIPPAQLEYGTDNCAVPTFHIPLHAAAMAFARLATGRRVTAELATAAAKIVAAMTTYPEMVGGEDSFDSDLMRVAGGAIVAKGGAEGFQGLGLIPAGLGLAGKISDGNGKALPPAVLSILTEQGWLATTEGLEHYGAPVIQSMRGEVVGEMIPVFHIGVAL